MRTIERTARFKRDYRRESRGRHRASLDASLVSVVEALANDQPLEPRRHDHALSGEWSDHRDCHVKPDLILIYQKLDADTLRLVRLGSHSELGSLKLPRVLHWPAGPRARPVTDAPAVAATPAITPRLSR